MNLMRAILISGWVFLSATMSAFGGRSEDSEIICSASLGSENGTDGLFLRIKSKSNATLYLRADEAPWASPNNITVFFSVDGRKQPDPAYWRSALIAYEIPEGVSLELRPNQELIRFIPIEEFFPAAAELRKKQNVYLYWSVAVNYYRSDPFHRNEKLETSKVPVCAAPRIGGFETLRRIDEP